MPRLFRTASMFCLAFSVTAGLLAQQAEGTLTANGKKAQLHYAWAAEVDSTSEPGYLDVRIVLADRELSREDRMSDDRIAELTRKQGLAALVVVLNPDARPMSAAPYHPAFTAYITSGAFVEFEPSAYDDKVAGRLHSRGLQDEFNQKWQYDVTFSAEIELDPDAVTTSP